MIAKKISNKKSGSKAGRVAGVANYIVEPERENGLEKCIHHEAENFFTDTHEGHIAEMTALAQDAVRSKDPIDHWMLSWRPEERPSVDQVREAVNIFTEHCGLKGHQIIWGLHDDTKNLHVHIAINRVHPETLKVIEINKGFQKEAAQQAVAIIEKKQGWKSVENARYKTNEKGELLIDSKTKRPAKAKSKDKPLEPTGPAKDMEIQTGEKSAQRIGIEQATPIIAQATSWKELHAAMADAGMQYQRKGSGAVVQVGAEFVKASSITPKASLSALQKRLGPYQPPQEIKPNEYHHHPSHTVRSLTGAIVATKKPHSPALGKAPGNGLRNLSECTLAVLTSEGKTRCARVLHIDGRAGGRPADGLRRDAGHGRENRKLTPQPLKENQPGWNEYIAIRDSQRAEKTKETIALKNIHDAERAALAAKQKAERDDIFKGNWQGKGKEKNLLKSLTATQQAAEKLELQERHSDERKALQAKYKPLPIYKQWKEQPQIVGLSVQPLIDQHNTRARQVTVAQTLRSLTNNVDARQHITYRLNNKDVFRDEGRTIAVLDLKSDAGIAAALATAQQKFGNVLELTGSDEFKRNAVAVAVANNLTCKFADPELEKLREQLQAEQYQATREAARAVRDREAAAKQLEQPENPTSQQLTPRPADQSTTAERFEALKAAKKSAREAEAKAPAQTPAPEAQQPVLLDREIPPVDYLADIHEKIDLAKAAAAPGSSLANSTTTEADHEVSGSGVILAANVGFVAVLDRHKVQIYKASELVKNLTYDGLDTTGGCFAKGNELIRKRGADGMRTVVTENRLHMQSPENRKDNRGVGR